MKNDRPSYKDFKKEALKNPELKAEYEALKPIYNLKKQMIKARIEANLTQEDVAQKLHTRKSNISRLESLNAKHLPNLGTLMQYAEAVGWELEVTFKK
ncbi:MAG: helix-turn-helix transcriptional regulator [Campylobacterales bacterium]